MYNIEHDKWFHFLSSFVLLYNIFIIIIIFVILTLLKSNLYQ